MKKSIFIILLISLSVGNAISQWQYTVQNIPTDADTAHVHKGYGKLYLSKDTGNLFVGQGTTFKKALLGLTTYSIQTLTLTDNTDTYTIKVLSDSLVFQNDASTPLTVAFIDSSGAFGLTDGTDTYTLKVQNDSLFFQNDASTPATITWFDSSGNFGANNYIYHNGDSDTYTRYLDDRYVVVAGNESMLDVIEAAQDSIVIGGSGGSGDIDINLSGGSMFIRGSDGFVGIGNVAPDYELDVAGDIGTDRFLVHNGDDDTYLKYLDDRFIMVSGNESMFDAIEGSQDSIVIGGSGGSGDIDINLSETAVHIQGDNENVGFGTSTFDGTAVNTLHIINGTAPGGGTANTSVIYTSGGEGYWMDASGNASLQTQHSSSGHAIIYSANQETGKHIYIKLELLAKALDKLSLLDEKICYEWYDKTELKDIPDLERYREKHIRRINNYWKKRKKDLRLK